MLLPKLKVSAIAERGAYLKSVVNLRINMVNVLLFEDRDQHPLDTYGEAVKKSDRGVDASLLLEDSRPAVVVILK